MHHNISRLGAVDLNLGLVQQLLNDLFVAHRRIVLSGLKRVRAVGNL
jgi:hypothetical protein